MSKVRVYEVAKQLNMDPKSVVAHFQSMGIGDVRNHMSAVESDVVDRFKRHLERQKSPEIVEERIRPTVVKRRARVAEPEVASVRSPVVARPADGPPPAQHVPEAARSSAGERPIARASSTAAAPRPSSTTAAGPASVAEVSRSPEAAPSRPGAVPAAAPSGAGQASVEAPVAEPSRGAAEVAPPSAKRSGVGASVKSSRASSARAIGGELRTSVGDLDFDGEPDAHAPPSAPQAQGEIAASPISVEAPKSSRRGAKPSARGRTASEDRNGAAQASSVEATAPIEASMDAPPVSVPIEAVPPTQASPDDGSAYRAPMRAEEGAAAGQAATASASTAPAAVEPRRPSSPPRTGIDVWQGRPGVPMPAQRASTPPPRRTTYDPRAAAAPARPGAGFPPGRPGMQGGRNRPGFGPQGRRGPIGPSMPKRPAIPSPEMAAHKKIIRIEEQVSLQKLAAMMSLKVTDVLMRLLSMGMTGVHINSTIDSDTAKILASEFGWTVEDVAFSEEATLAGAMGEAEMIEGDLLPRPPIVTVMGHVDHGKTSLLDRIRKASVAAGEAGGITQHIGAYRVETARGTIAFLDTPGHEAFTAMRARGASATDIVILVVAADDGVMPQTKEAINHAQAAKVPIVVAINKIDKQGADVDKIKRDLASLGLQPEEWGGQTIFMPVSALTGQGVEELLESVAVQAEVLELRASPKRRASGVVIEALLDRGRGPVARVMIQDGTLRPGDVVIAGPAWGKVRAMTDELGRSLSFAGPSTPIEVLGLNEVPSAGDPVHAVKDGKTAEEIAETRRKKANKSLIPQDSRVSLEALKERLSENEQLDLKLIIKGDVQGSVEAVGSALAKLTGAKVKVTIVHAAVGAITEGDVNLAIAAKAIIVGFNVRPAGKASSLAETGGVEIRLYNIIYNAVDDIRAAMEGLLPTTKIEKELGKAEVRKVFKITKVGIVAGCMVVSGSIKRGCDARLVRDSIVVFTGKLSSVRRVKEDVKEVAEGTECGISLDNYSDVKEGDIIEAFEIEEVKTKL